jgi:hypothetical protein
MRRVVDLLVPQGMLTVEQVFQEFRHRGEVAAIREVCRTAYLNGVPVWWQADTCDLLRAADDALALLPSPLPSPFAGARR